MSTTTLNSNALTTVQAVEDELGIVCDDSATRFIKRKINSYSAAIEKYLARELAEAAVVEDVNGYGHQRLIVVRTPVTVLTNVEIINGITSIAIVLADVVIENATVGFLYHRSGWPWAVPRPRGTIAGDPNPGLEEPTVRVTYTGGFILPADQPAVAPQIDLPADIQEAATISVVEAFNNRGRNMSVVMEKIGDYTAKFAEGQQEDGLGAPHLSATARGLLAPHRVVRV